MNQHNTTYMYYPGCSLKSTANAYDRSSKHVAERLGIVFEEIDDWNVVEQRILHDQHPPRL